MLIAHCGSDRSSTVGGGGTTRADASGVPEARAISRVISSSMSSETSSGAASNLCAFEREKAGDLECRLGEIEEEREGPAIWGTGVSSRGVTPFPFPIFPNMDMMLSGNFEFLLKAGSVPYILST